MDDTQAIAAVIAFWFDENGREQWFAKDPALDAAIRTRFATLHGRAANGELSHWRATPRGALAEIIVLDQFSRNLYRDDARAFACDPLAREAAREAIEKGHDRVLSETGRVFLYLPYEHGEEPADQEMSVSLFSTLSDHGFLEWAEQHKAVIDRFGRFPGRNEALGRISTAAERAFLEEPGSSF